MCLSENKNEIQMGIKIPLCIKKNQLGRVIVPH